MFAASPLPRGDEATGITGREMWQSSRAGAKGWGACGHGRLPSVLGAAWQAWPGTPRVGAWLPTYVRGRDRQLERDGIVSSRSLCPVRRSQAGDGKYRALGSPCPLCAPSVEQWAEPEHPSRQPGM